ncbi:MAG: mqnB [Segetibacter sp.]|jgi:futalosine hydrolase|nr:mqnB [Segetibacter sp.]
MKVVITSATEREISPIKQTIDPLYTGESSRLRISFHESGVGILASCFSISKLIFEEKPDLIIQAGIAGTFNNDTPLSKVVAVKEEYVADTGVEENSNLQDLFDLNLQHPNLFPFTNRKLVNPMLEKINLLNLDEVTAITINEITTRQERIDQLKEKYRPEIESMEGASLHYCCLQTYTPFIQIRAISNYVGDRDKSNWKFKESFENLASIIERYIDALYTIK